MQQKRVIEVDEDLTPLWPAGFGAWIRIGRVYQSTYRLLGERLKTLGISVAQFDALANLYVGDGIRQQELASRLLVTKGNVTGLVNRLVDRGWVERQPDPDDGRAHRVVLTRRGRSLAKKALRVQRGVVDEMMGALSQAQRETLRSTLTELTNRLDTMSGTLKPGAKSGNLPSDEEQT
ncbi:MAG: MarR family transcriptional regulator [Myxococcales bacterium]|nr:MarR family transcriptional regulator [Myxococcales bacterium]